LTQHTTTKTIIWLIGVFFLLFQFFLQLSSGIVVGAIMHEQHLSALTAGLLSSSFYYVYTTLQIPVGMLFDRYNTRTLLYANAALCALGCFIFATAPSLPLLFLGRLVIGAGSAFAFVGLSHLLREHYPLRQYAFMIGASETLGFTITVFGMIGMGSFISSFGWRYFIGGAGFIGLFIAFLCWNFIPDSRPERSANHHYKQQLLEIIKNKLAWINGLFVCLEFSVITVFGAMWAVPFLQLKLNCGIEAASILTSMILLGAGVSCPVFGQISIRLSKRKPLIHASCLSTAVLVLITLFLPTKSMALMGFVLFAMGLCCGAYMLAYSIANELAPAESLSTCTGFTNTLAMLSAPLLQPLVGYILDMSNAGPGQHTLGDYQFALLIIPLSLVLASLLAHFLPEKSQ
jgi:MFS family permease